jgi:fumarate hydratase class II
MTTLDTVTLTNVQKETDSLGEVDVPADVLWGAQTQRSLDQFSIGHDLIPREMITSYATLKKAATNVNHAAGRLSDRARERSFEMSLGVDRSRRTAVAT